MGVRSKVEPKKRILYRSRAVRARRVNSCQNARMKLTMQHQTKSTITSISAPRSCLKNTYCSTKMYSNLLWVFFFSR